MPWGFGAAAGGAVSGGQMSVSEASRFPAGPRWQRLAPAAIVLASFLLGLSFFLLYYSKGLTLVHYDAKARLLVARRTFDNIRPGLDQIGLYWLPLPALLQAPTVIASSTYHNGVPASLLSVACFALTTLFIYRLIFLLRSDHVIGICGAAVFATNSAMLYLQSTPLIESLYCAVAVGTATYMARFFMTEDRGDLVAAAVLLALTTLVHPDGWSLWAGSLVLFALGAVQSPARGRVRWKYVLSFASLATAGIFIFRVYAIYASGEWWPRQADARPLEAFSKGDLLRSIAAFVRCAGAVAGAPIAISAAVGLLVFLAHRRFRRPYLAAYALLHPIPLFALAYFNGHPYRIRYSAVLLPAIAVFAAVWWPARRWGRAALGVLVLANLIRPAEERQALLREAMFHLPEIREREQAIRYLEREYDGEPVLASMGWIAPFLHDWGIPLRYIVHEGSFTAWENALSRPAQVVGWILIEDGDSVDQVRKDNPNFSTGFVRVLRLSNFSVYRRTEIPPRRIRRPQPPRSPAHEVDPPVMHDEGHR